MRSKYLISFLTAALLLSGCSKKSDWHTINYPTAKTQFAPDFIPVSTWYSGGKARAPMLSEITENSENEWRQDLQQIKDLGFNTVRTWVEWAHCEPRRGEYHFENLRLLCRLADEVGLKVFIQLYLDSAPDWVGKKFTDSEYEAQNGAKVHSQAAPGYCTDHAGVRQAVENFLHESAKVANEYPNFYGWDLWSEPLIVNWAYIDYVPDAQFCFCPSTLQVFRQWLQAKYGSLEALNTAWYRNFEKWDEVQPPRFGTILSYTDFIDWKNFIYDKLAGDLKMRYDAIRFVDKSHVITSHAAVPSIFYSPYNGYGATDDFYMAQQIDYYGTSLYPKHNNPKTHWEYWKFMVAVDFTRSANWQNGGFYVGEMQAGKGTIGLNVGNPITPSDHKTWMWTVISRGAKAINIYAYYPMSSGYESGGYGLVNLDGSVTERAQKAGETARIITDNKDLFLSSKPYPAEVAIVYNPLAQMVGGEQHGGVGDMHRNSLISYYRTFAENNIPVDFIHRRDLESRDLSQFKLIIVPYPLMFTQKAADGLKAFVANGGKVLSEARLAWNDERGFAAPQIPGMGLAEVFGATESKVRMGESFDVKIINTNHPALQGLKVNDLLKGAYFAESLQLAPNSSAKILATLEDGSAALVANQFGSGETLLMGTFLALANHPVWNKFDNRFIVNLVNWAGIQRPFTTSHDGNSEFPVEVRLMENPEGLILFIFSHSDKTENVAVNLNVNKDGSYALNELTYSLSQTATAVGKILPLKFTVSAKDVQVWVIKPKE
ncbi:MAG: beta-galactosidase [Candidatus Neomarinimicrobiota bacterium]